MADLAHLVARVHKYLEAWQRQNLRSYCFFVVLPLLVCGGAYTTVLYGFSVLMLPIRQEFHPNEPWSMATGSPVYVSSLMMLLSSTAAALLGGRLAGRPDDTSGRWLRLACLGGSVLYCSGLVLAAVAMKYRQLWLLYAGCSLLSGLGSGGIYLSNSLSVLLHFRAAGCGGLGSGLLGCILGLWPTVFACTWRIIDEAVGTSGAFYALAAIVLVLAIPPSLLLRLPPPAEISAEGVQAEGVPVQEAVSSEEEVGEALERGVNETATSGEAVEASENAQSVSEDSSGSTCTPPSSEAEQPKPTGLRRGEVAQQCSFWLVAVGVSSLMLPGFGMKLLLGPEMYAVYHADQAVQDNSSAMFLLTYSAMRLVTGLSADRFNLWRLYLMLGGLQTAMVTLLGVCVYVGWPQEVFLGLLSTLGMLLASSKVLMPLLCFKVWAPKDASTALGLVCLAWGVAALIGSGSAWATLCQMRMEGGRPAAGDQDKLTHAVAAWFLMCALLSAGGTSCIFVLSRRAGDARKAGES